MRSFEKEQDGGGEKQRIRCNQERQSLFAHIFFPSTLDLQKKLNPLPKKQPRLGRQPRADPRRDPRGERLEDRPGAGEKGRRGAAVRELVGGG